MGQSGSVAESLDYLWRAWIVRSLTSGPTSYSPGGLGGYALRLGVLVDRASSGGAHALSTGIDIMRRTKYAKRREGALRTSARGGVRLICARRYALAI